MTEDEIRRLIKSEVTRLIEEYLSERLGEMACEAINARRKAQGKPEMDL